MICNRAHGTGSLTSSFGPAEAEAAAGVATTAWHQRAYWAMKKWQPLCGLWVVAEAYPHCLLVEAELQKGVLHFTQLRYTTAASRGFAGELPANAPRLTNR